MRKLVVASLALVVALACTYPLLRQSEETSPATPRVFGTAIVPSGCPDRSVPIVRTAVTRSESMPSAQGILVSQQARSNGGNVPHGDSSNSATHHAASHKGTSGSTNASRPLREQGDIGPAFVTGNKGHDTSVMFQPGSPTLSTTHLGGHAAPPESSVPPRQPLVLIDPGSFLPPEPARDALLQQEAEELVRAINEPGFPCDSQEYRAHWDQVVNQSNQLMRARYGDLVWLAHHIHAYHQAAGREVLPP